MTINDTDALAHQPTSNLQHNSRASETVTFTLPTTKANLSIKVIHKQLRYRVTQEDKIARLKHADTIPEFISARELAQYIGMKTRPDVCAPIKLIAPGNTPPPNKEIRLLKNITTFMKDTCDQGLDYVKLYLRRTGIVLVTDASFANTKDLKIQLGYVVLMVDEVGNCNVLNYASNRSKRIERNLMAANLFSLVLGFDNAYIVRDLVEEIIGKRMEIDAIIDIKTVFYFISKRSQTAEKRLQIDILSLREN